MAGTGPDDQAASTAAFELLEAIVDERLRRGLTTVVDTLGYDEDRRRRWIDAAHTAGVPVYAVLFEIEAAHAERHNTDRDRSIPKTVLRKQVSRFKEVAPAVAEEGFDGVLTERPVATVAPQFATDPAVPAAATTTARAKINRTPVNSASMEFPLRLGHRRGPASETTPPNSSNHALKHRK